jgi:hypothetical protein
MFTVNVKVYTSQLFLALYLLNKSQNAAPEPQNVCTIMQTLFPNGTDGSPQTLLEPILQPANFPGIVRPLALCLPGTDAQNLAILIAE